MGTSGAYGGSARQAWTASRDRIAELVGDTVVGSGSDSSNAAAIDALLGAISDDDPAVAMPRITTSILPGLATSSQPGRAGFGVGGHRISPAVTGGGRSRRRISRGARLGGLAVGAGYAIRQGNADSLLELGIVLADIAGMSPAQQCLEILNALIGDSGHPDETALRHALIEVLEFILTASELPDPISMVKQFISRFVFQIMLVEIGDALLDSRLDAERAARLEDEIEGWLDARLEHANTPDESEFRIPTDFEFATAAILAEARHIQQAATS